MTKQEQIEALGEVQELLREAVKLMDDVSNYGEQPDMYFQRYTRNVIESLIDDSSGWLGNRGQTIQDWIEHLKAIDEPDDESDDDPADTYDRDWDQKVADESLRHCANEALKEQDRDLDETNPHYQ